MSESQELRRWAGENFRHAELHGVRPSTLRARALAGRAATVGRRFPVREPSLLSGVDVVATAVATVAVVGIGALVGLWLRKKRLEPYRSVNGETSKSRSPYVVGAYVLGAR